MPLPLPLAAPGEADVASSLGEGDTGGPAACVGRERGLWALSQQGRGQGTAAAHRCTGPWQTGIASARQVLVFNGTELPADGGAQLHALGVRDNDMVLVRTRPAPAAAAAAAPAAARYAERRCVRA
jgi:hypothetical protein